MISSTLRFEQPCGQKRAIYLCRKLSHRYPANVFLTTSFWVNEEFHPAKSSYTRFVLLGFCLELGLLKRPFMVKSRISK